MTALGQRLPFTLAFTSTANLEPSLNHKSSFDCGRKLESTQAQKEDTKTTQWLPTAGRFKPRTFFAVR